ncbi:MAG: hypothetical protein EOO48_04305 [Flavobacterium sp.]|nr:MAG: hypothetical protein EOO48_04305 [Flavobacterium sp.]
MKTIKNLVALAAMAVACFSCSNDDGGAPTGTGNLGIEFDNAFKNNDLVLGSPGNITSLGESLTISNVKYIISNIVLTKEDGSTFTYPKSDSYFIVDESDENTHVLELESIPAGNYNKVTFGVGVDESQYNLGESAQGGFLSVATAAGMLPDWPNGFTSLSMAGQFTSPTVSATTDFLVKTGKTPNQYNYTEVTLDLPTKALVRTNITPEIHIVADVSKVIDGNNKIALSEHINSGSVTITDGSLINQMVANFPQMFSVAHVHND